MSEWLNVEDRCCERFFAEGQTLLCQKPIGHGEWHESGDHEWKTESLSRPRDEHTEPTVCGAKMMQDWVPNNRSLFCNLPKGHDGDHAFKGAWQPIPEPYAKALTDKYLPPSEQKELQVSLLNALVQLEHSFDVIAEVQANSYDAVVTKFEAIYKRLEPCKVCAGKRRVHALFERKTLENKATTVDEIMAAHDGRKPRKAGKRKRVKR